MLCSCNTQCVANNAECHIIVSALMHSPLIFWSSEEHCRHWINAPKDAGSRMIWNVTAFLAEHPKITSQVAAIFIPYSLLERSCSHVTDKLAWPFREKITTLFVIGAKFIVFYDMLCWYCLSISCGPWQTRPEDISHASMLSLAYSDRLLDSLDQGCQTHILPRHVVWVTPTFGNHI